MAALPPNTRAVARHALGLPNGAHESYRNFYVCPRAAEAHAGWSELVDGGLAALVRNDRSYIAYALTRAGAELALDPGETLSPESFPEVLA